ncbi:hypothetical protein QL093DRAFT_2233437 [Fusarium oxysporum]|nr:hypothetical protein QL093DRAFT_2233437 [Fusarium oxysporum]
MSLHASWGMRQNPGAQTSHCPDTGAFQNQIPSSPLARANNGQLPTCDGFSEPIPSTKDDWPCQIGIFACIVGGLLEMHVRLVRRMMKVSRLRGTPLWLAQSRVLRIRMRGREICLWWLTCWDMLICCCWAESLTPQNL